MPITKYYNPTPPVKKWRGFCWCKVSLPHMPLLTTTSTFGLRRRCWSSPQQLATSSPYLHNSLLRLNKHTYEVSKIKRSYSPVIEINDYNSQQSTNSYLFGFQFLYVLVKVGKLLLSGYNTAGRDVERCGAKTGTQLFIGCQSLAQLLKPLLFLCAQGIDTTTKVLLLLQDCQALRRLHHYNTHPFNDYPGEPIPER